MFWGFSDRSMKLYGHFEEFIDHSYDHCLINSKALKKLPSCVIFTILLCCGKLIGLFNFFFWSDYYLIIFKIL